MDNLNKIHHDMVWQYKVGFLISQVYGRNLIICQIDNYSVSISDVTINLDYIFLFQIKYAKKYGKLYHELERNWDLLWELKFNLRKFCRYLLSNVVIMT